MGQESSKAMRLTAGFRDSYREDTAYLFVMDMCVSVDYRPCSSEDRVTKPVKIYERFPGLKGTIFGTNGIDCAFATHEDGKAYIFFSNYCALLDHSVPGSMITKGPMLIAEMFPCLKGTFFENGIDAAFESSKRYEAYLFKGEASARISYANNRLIEQGPIPKLWPCLKGTALERDIDAAFASHRYNNAYLFKGEYYVRLKFTPDERNHEIPSGVMTIGGNFPNLAGLLGMPTYLGFSVLKGLWN